MNVTFRLPDHRARRRFVSQAAARGLAELQGHRSVGGIRASIYNAMPLDGVAGARRVHARVRRLEPLRPDAVLADRSLGHQRDIELGPFGVGRSCAT